MKYLIIGLGNPGSQYENTRHNIGFKVLDKICAFSDSSFFSDRYANISQIRHKGRVLILIKPNTFMNLSGKAVKYWMEKEKVLQENILVVTDDISLPFGVLRLRKKGSDGGHNGLKNIQEVLGNNRYPRLRFGIGNDFPKGFQADYVLSDFSSENSAIIEEKIELAIKIIKGFTTIGIEHTMSEFNRK